MEAATREMLESGFVEYPVEDAASLPGVVTPG